MKFYSSFSITPENCLSNRAISYGDGLFETMLVSHKNIPLWDLHFQRLESSLDRLNMDSPLKSLVKSKIMSLIFDDNCYVAKLVVFRDDLKQGYGTESRKTHYYIVVNTYKKPLENQNLTVSSVKLSHQNQLAGLKHLNRMEQVLAVQALNGSNYSDAIMLDHKDNMIETTKKNIVMIKNNMLYTPKLNKCGVYGVALRWLQQQGFNLKWKKIEFKSLQKYDGMLVCNSIQGFTFITNINNKIKYKQQPSIIKDINEQWKNIN
jgi:4-amino-4-deoxychorismate lyase